MDKKRNQKKKNNKGFSLVELIVVIAIMAVLVAVLAPTLLGNIEKSRESKDMNTLDAVYSAVQTAFGDEAGNTAVKTATGYTDIKEAKGVELATIASDTDAFTKGVKEYLGGKNPALESSNASVEGNSIRVSIIEGKIRVWVGNGEDDKAAAASKLKTANGNAKEFVVE